MKTEQKDDGLTLSIANGSNAIDLHADKVLVAVGRAANTNGLGLDSIGVKIDSKGFIAVDEHLRTNVDGIFAVGDVIGPPYLAHKAQSQAIVAAENSTGGNKKFDFNNIPSAIYTTPEISAVGLTEKEAIDRGYSVSIGKFQFGANGRALTAREKDGLVKVVVDKKTSIVLGVHIAGPDASNLISEASLALRLKATVEDIESTIHPHPTFAEAFAEAVSAAMGRSIHSVVKR
jgi:dihydrolipoamide dehydrogenase